MKAVGLSLIFIFLLVPRGIFSQEEGTEGGHSLEISRRLALSRLLTEEGIPFEVRSLFTEYGGFGASIVVYLPPKAAAEPDGAVFVLAIPLRSEDEPGEGFPYGLEAGLAFIKKARERDLNREIWVAFLGDEPSRLPPDLRKGSHTGLEDLLTLPEDPENTIMFYADFYDPPEKILVHHSGGKTPAPLSLLQPIPGLCASYGVPFTFAVKSNELYKLGVVEGPSVLASSLTYGTPSLYLEGTQEEDGPAGQPIPVELLGDLLLGYTEALDFSAENLDYHYLIFQFRDKTVFVPELITIIILWSLSALGFFIFLIYSIVLRRMLIIQGQIFLRRSWVIVMLFIILFLCLEAAELFFSFLLSGFALPQDHISYGSIIFTLSIALTLFSLIDPLFNRLKIPRRANFYGTAAVILIILGTLIAIFLDITFIPAFMWAFLFTILAALLPFSLPVYVIALIIPLQIAGILLTSMGPAGTGLPILNRFHQVWLILFIAVAALPSVLIFKRASALAVKRKKTPSLWLISRSILLAGCMGALTFYTYRLSLNPPLPPVRRLITESPDNPSILDVTITGRSFLARRILEINLQAREEPVRFDLYLDSTSDPQPIYAAPMPFIHRETENSPFETTLEFVLGENPPNPFTTDIVLPRTFSGFLRVEALYTRYDPSLDPEPPPTGDDYVLRVTRTIPIGFGEN
ncbi:hypothetical protein LQZ21_02865 [Treponema sp. TIM-1]|uniref:hypothetical protein n=1 Tax=Treponema sp. TIM-1 TaxID=2898417 RepID=UPI003980DC01